MNASKRILCIILALVLCMSSAVIAVSAVAEGQNEVNRKYEEQILALSEFEIFDNSYIYECVMEYNADGSTVDEGEIADYALVFFHTGATLCWEYKETIGNYQLNHVSAYNPFPTGYVIYSTAEAKVYTLREAWDLRLPNIETVLEMLGTKVSLYAETFEGYLKPYAEDWDFSMEWYYYDELYYYSVEKGGTTEIPEATPDYVLVKATTYNASPMNFYDVFGDYIIQGGCGFPYCGNYHIYAPADGEIYTLREAYDAELEGIMNVFTDYPLGCLLGDADGDRRLTIKDATYIQKCLAKMDGFKLQDEYGGHNLSETEDTSPDIYVRYIEDFDNNDVVNIKDATAIQKHLAKISE